MKLTVVRFDWWLASIGMPKRSCSSPIGRSARALAVGVAPGFSTVTCTCTASCTLTRRCETSIDAWNDVLPSESTSAASSMATHTRPAASISCQPSVANRVRQMAAHAIVAQPSGEM